MDLFDLSAVLTLDTSQYERGIDSARDSANGLNDSMNGTQGALGRAEKGFTVFKGVLSNVISGGVNALANAITNNLGGAISRVDTLNNYSIVMQNLGHGAEESEKAIDALVEGIDGLPTTLDGIASIQQQFVALGGSMEDATELTLALNNATLAGGQGQEKANAAMAQWYQMIAAGKPDLMSMRIINEAMPAQLDAIAKSVIGADANWQELNTEWQKNPEITQKVKDAIVQLNEEGLNGTAGFAQQAKDATQGIQTSMQNMQTAIKNGIANIITEFGTDNIAKGFAVMKDAIKASFGEVVTFMQSVKEIGLGDAILQEIEKARDVVWKGFVALMDIDWGSLFSTAFKGLGQAFTSYYEIALQLDTLGTNLYQRLMAVGVEMIEGFIEGVISQGANLVTQGIDAVSNFVSGIYENSTKVVESATRLMDRFITYLSNNSDRIASSAVKMVLALGKGIVKNAPKILLSIAKLQAAIIKGILRIVPKLPPLALKMVVSLAGAIGRGASRALSAAKSMAQGVVNGIRGAFNNVADIGRNLVYGIGRGITSGIGWIKGQISSFVGNVKSFLKSLFGISSPSKWARDIIGLNIDKGMALGIEQNADMVEDAVNDLIPNIESTGFTTTTAGNGSSTYKGGSNFTNYFTINDASNAEQVADEITRRLSLQIRSA